MSNSSTLLDTISTAQSNKEVVINALMDAASPATLWGRHASACSGLTWGYYGGSYVTPSATNSIANGTLTLAASTTNYVEASATTGAIDSNTTGFTAGEIPLYTIVTGASAVTSYTDLRSYQPSAVGSSETLSGLSDVNVTEGSGIDGYALVWHNATSKWIAAAAGGTVTSVALSMPSEFAVSGSPVTGAGTLAVTLATQAENTVFAGPSSGAAAAPTFRALVAGDLPAIALSSLSDVNVTEGSGINGYVLTWNNSTSKWVASAASSGTVSSVGLSLPSSILTVSGSPVTSSGTLSATLATQTAAQVFAGPTSGAASAPAFRALVTTDLPAIALSGLSDVNVTEGSGINGYALTWNNSTSKWVASALAGGTVTSVGLSLPSSILTVSGSPVTASGTLSATLATQTAAQVFAGPVTGSAAAPTFRSLASTDLPAIALSSLSDVNVTEGAGINGYALTWNNSTSKWVATALTTGTVTSVALSSVAGLMTATGSPITSSGTLGFSVNTQAAAHVYAGPATGTALTPTFRALVATDLPASNPAMAGKNYVINGACNVAQYASATLSAAGSTYGGVDRFKATLGGSAGGSFTQSQGTITYNGVTYNAVTQTVVTAISSTTGTNFWNGISQIFEGQSVHALLGQPLALGLLFNTNVGGTYSVALRDGGGTYTYLETFTAVANTPILVQLTLPTLPTAASVPNTTAAGLVLVVGAINTGTYQGTAGTTWQSALYISASGAVNWGATVGNFIQGTLIKLEAGTVCTPFNDFDVEVELGRCTRYYELLLGSSSPAGIYGFGTVASATAAYAGITYAYKRTTPSLSFSAAANFTFSAPAANVTLSAISSGLVGLSSASLNLTSSGMTAGQAGFLEPGAGAYIGVSAEL